MHIPNLNPHCIRVKYKNILVQHFWWNPATEWNTYARKKKLPAPCHSLLSSPFGNFFGYSLLLITLTTCPQKIPWLTCASFLPKQLWLASVVTATGQFHLLRHVRRELLMATDGNLASQKCVGFIKIHRIRSCDLHCRQYALQTKGRLGVQWWGNIWKHHVLRSRSQQLTSSYVKIPQKQTRQRYKMSWLGSMY